MARSAENLKRAAEFNRLVDEISSHLNGNLGKGFQADKWASQMRSEFLWSGHDALNAWVMRKAEDYRQFDRLMSRMREINDGIKFLDHLGENGHPKGFTSEDWCCIGLGKYMTANYKKAVAPENAEVPARRVKFEETVTTSLSANEVNTEESMIELAQHTKEFKTLVKRIRIAMSRKVRPEKAVRWEIEMKSCFLWDGARYGTLNAWIMTNEGDCARWKCLKRRLEEMLVLANTDSKVDELVQQIQGDREWSSNGIFRHLQTNYKLYKVDSLVKQEQDDENILQLRCCLLQ